MIDRSRIGRNGRGLETALVLENINALMDEVVIRFRPGLEDEIIIVHNTGISLKGKSYRLNAAFRTSFKVMGPGDDVRSGQTTVGVVGSFCPSLLEHGGKKFVVICLDYEGSNSADCQEVLGEEAPAFERRIACFAHGLGLRSRAVTLVNEPWDSLVACATGGVRERLLPVLRAHILLRGEGRSLVPAMRKTAVVITATDYGFKAAPLSEEAILGFMGRFLAGAEHSLAGFLRTSASTTSSTSASPSFLTPGSAATLAPASSGFGRPSSSWRSSSRRRAPL